MRLTYTSCSDIATGLNGLKGFNIVAAQALLTPDPDGSNFRGVANLPNPSIVAFELVRLPTELIRKARHAHDSAG
jgi:hypothetical protein